MFRRQLRCARCLLLADGANRQYDIPSVQNLGKLVNNAVGEDYVEAKFDLNKMQIVIKFGGKVAWVAAAAFVGGGALYAWKKGWISFEKVSRLT